MKTIQPKNGKFPVVLLAGGPADLAREIGERLSTKLGVVVGHHWEGDKLRQWQRNIPEDVDLTIFLKDFASHAQEDLMARQCSSQRVPLLRTQRKWSAMYSALHAVYGMSSSTAAEVPAVVPAPVLPPDAPAPGWTEPPPVEPAPAKPRQRRTPGGPRSQAAAPPAAPAAPRGSPSEEAMVLVAKLMALAARDRFNVMITPEEVTISASK